MQESKIAYSLLMFEHDIACTKLMAWRMDNSGEKPHWELDGGGRMLTYAAHDLTIHRDWSHQGVGIGHIWHVRPARSSVPTEAEYQKLLPAQLKRLEALDPTDPELPAPLGQYLVWLHRQRKKLERLKR